MEGELLLLLAVAIYVALEGFFRQLGKELAEDFYRYIKAVIRKKSSLSE